MTDHAPNLDTLASAGRDEDPTAPATAILTRREMRDQERLASAEHAGVAGVARVAVVPGVPAAEGAINHLLVTSSESTASTVIPVELSPRSRADLRADRAPARGVRARRQPVTTARTTTARSSDTEAPFAPVRRFVPSATAAPASPGRAPVARARRLATKAATVAAMSFVALMAVATSLPAEALLSSADVQTAVQASQQKGATEPPQTLDLAGGDTIMLERDGYESSTIADSAAASGIRMEDTFTNNPNGVIQWPFAVGVHIGDQFGYRNCAGCSVNHGGQDFNPGVGAPIQAISDGVVSLVQDGEGSLGVHMIIDHMIDGELVSSVYAHMIHGSMLFKAGDVIKVGQVLGKTGSTGMSTGPHLHFEIRIGGIGGVKVDALKWLYAHTD